MPTPPNPFPGLNPFFQADWIDVHPTLLTLIRSALREELPSDLMLRVEERVEVADTGKEYRADISVVEPWQRGFPPLWRPDDESSAIVTVTEPMVYFLEPERERWLEIRDARGRVITVIQLISPTNKSDGGWREYRQKQADLLAGGVNLVEIDFFAAVSTSSRYPSIGLSKRRARPSGSVWRETREVIRVGGRSIRVP